MRDSKSSFNAALLFFLTILIPTVQCGYDCSYKFEGDEATKYCFYYENKSNQSANIGPIIGGSLGCLAALVIIIVACVKLCRDGNPIFRIPYEYLLACFL